MAIKCRIWWDLNSKSYVVSSSFNEKLVEGLKHVIPSTDRWFDNSTKFWYLKEPYGDAVRLVAEKVFGVGQISFQSKTVAEQAQAQPQQQAYGYVPPATVVSSLNELDRAILSFVRMIPYEACKKAFQVSALTLHPDRGGDPVRMSELNQMWSLIERELYHK
jgi:hypothetical protein